MKLDFPFYNDPEVKVKDIIILVLMPILFTIYTFSPLKIPFGLAPYIFCFSQLGAFLYVAHGKISLLIQKPSFRDILRVFGTLILQYIAALVLAMFLRYALHLCVNDNGIFDLNMGVGFWISIIVQLFGEELYKILIFLAVLILMYKKTNKRKLSIAVALIVSLFCFAILHMTTYNNILQILVLQGLCSIICYYNYLKTKNILTSYLQHFLFDAIPFILAMMHML